MFIFRILEQLNLKEIIRTNLRSDRGIQVLYFLSERDVDIHDYGTGHIVIPFSPLIRVVAYNSLRGKIQGQSSNLIMPESVFMKIMEDMESIGMLPVKLEMSGRGKDRISTQSTQHIIEYDAIRRYLEIGFSFRSCQFSDGTRTLNVERSSRLWSNSVDLISTIGNNVATYLSQAMQNFVDSRIGTGRDVNVLKRESMMMFTCSPRVLRFTRERIGHKKISYSGKLMDDSSLFFIPDKEKEGFIILHHLDETLRMKTIQPCSTNLMIDIVESIEKSGGVFIGR